MILHPIPEKFIVIKYRKGDFENIFSLWQDTGIFNIKHKFLSLKRRVV